MITFPGRNLRTEAPLRGEVVHKFSHRRKQVLSTIVAHLLGQRGAKTVQDLVQGDGRGLGPGNDHGTEFLGGDAVGELGGQEAGGIGQARRRPGRLVQLVAPPADDKIAAQVRRHREECRPARNPTGRRRRSAAVGGRRSLVPSRAARPPGPGQPTGCPALVEEGRRSRKRAVVQGTFTSVSTADVNPSRRVPRQGGPGRHD